MAITARGLQGSVTATSAGTTLAITNSTGAVIPAGTFIHITGTWDNINTATAPTITCSTVGGATAVANHATAVGQGQSATAGSGVWHQCFRVLTTGTIAAGATIATLTSNQSAVKRAAHAEGWTGIPATTLRGTVTTAVSAAGAPTVTTTGTALQINDLVIGSVSFENNSQMTADADTAGGAWPPIIGIATTGGAANTNVGSGSQYKILTATGTQTFNPTGGGADTVACVYSVIGPPPPGLGTSSGTIAWSGSATGVTPATLAVSQDAYRFYADTPGATELADSYLETNGDSNSIFGYVGGPKGVGQTFLGNGKGLAKASFYLNKLGTVSGPMIAKLYMHFGTFGSGTGLPVGTALATSTAQDASTITGTLAWVDFTFDGSVTLTNGAPYAIVLEASDVGANTSNTLQARTDLSSPTHPGCALTLNSSSVFSVTTSSDRMFRVYTTVSNETTSAALAAQDTSYAATLAADLSLALRLRLQSTTALDVPATDDWQLQWEKNAGGTWANVVAPLASTLVDSYDETNHAATANVTTGRGMGQSFLGNGRKLTRAGFFLGRSATPIAANLTAELYANSGTFGTLSTPTGTALAVSTTVIPVSALPTTRAWVEFDFDGSFTLTDGTPYVIAWVTDVAGDGTNSISVSTDNTTPTHPGNRCEKLSGGTWQVNTGTDLIFRLYTETGSAAASTVLPYNSVNLYGTEATTNRLTGGSGTFQAGEVSEDGQVNDLGWTGLNHTEVLYSLTLIAADLATSDTLRFRVVRNGSTSFLTYSQVPTFTVGAGAPAPNDGTSSGALAFVGGAAGARTPKATATTGALALVGAAAGARTPKATSTGALSFVGAAAGVSGVPVPVPVIVGTPASAIQASGTTLTFSKPAGLANGDYLIAALRSQQATSSTDWTLSGFTRAPGPTFIPNDASARVQGFYYKKVTNAFAEPSSYTFTVGGTANRAAGLLMVVRGVDATSPFLGNSTVGYGGDSVTNGRRITAYTVPNPALLLYAGGSEFASPNNHVPASTPSGYAQIDLVTTSASTAVSRTALWVGQDDLSGGTTSNADITWAVASSPHAISIGARGTLVTVPSTGTSTTGAFAFVGTAAGARTPKATSTGAVSWVGAAVGSKAQRGSSTGALALVGAAAGKRTAQATSTGAVSLVGTGAGARTPKATATTGNVAWVGTAAGVAPTVGVSQGSSTGTLTWAGTASGVRAPKAASSGTVAWVGLAAGARTPKASSTGVVTWVGTAAGSRTPKASSTGAVSLVGLASGTRTPKASSTGVVTWTGLAVGSKLQRGSSTGAVTWAATAAGARTSRATSSGAVTWTGLAAGKRTPKGASPAGQVTWSGTASGVAPVVGVEQGSATGFLLWAGSSTGTRTPKASTTGAISFVGLAAGSKPQRGTGTGAVNYVGAAAGARVAYASSSGAITWQGYALAGSTRAGGGVGAISWVGAATGTAPVLGANGGTASGGITWAGAAAGWRVSSAAAAGTLTWQAVAAGGPPALENPTLLLRSPGQAWVLDSVGTAWVLDGDDPAWVLTSPSTDLVLTGHDHPWLLTEVR